MTEKEIIIATLRAQIFINAFEAKALAQYTLNLQANLRASVLLEANEFIMKQIKDLENENN